ncbi:MAG: hypothetical protein M1812_007067 [Candelaria pacifica]|nr:MAG: hypothetical protein M1812_007067 [Candelaria pacifica]
MPVFVHAQHIDYWTEEYAIGIDLGPRFATSAARARNGTIFTVARLEGDEVYRAMVAEFEKPLAWREEAQDNPLSNLECRTAGTTLTLQSQPVPSVQIHSILATTLRELIERSSASLGLRINATVITGPNTFQSPGSIRQGTYHETLRILNDTLESLNITYLKSDSGAKTGAMAFLDARCGRSKFPNRSPFEGYPNHDCHILEDDLLLVLDYGHSRLSIAEVEFVGQYFAYSGNLPDAAVYPSLGAQYVTGQDSLGIYRHFLLQRIKEHLGPFIYRRWLGKAGYEYSRFLLVGEASEDKELQAFLRDEFPSLKLETSHYSIPAGHEMAYGAAIMAEFELIQFFDPIFGISDCARSEGEVKFEFLTAS